MRGLQGCRLFTLAVLVLVAAPTIAFAQFSAQYKFGTNNGDPCDATNSGIVAQGRDGNLYSTAPWCGAYGYGAVFKITPAGMLTVLYSFGGKNGDGLNPRGGLTLGTDGNFYGTTAYGGTNLYGTVFKITSTGKLTVLYNFSNGSDGGVPFAAPVQGVDGNFYGTTCQCDGQNGPGTIYKITPSGKFTSLYQLDFWASSYPYAPLVQGIDGNFYGSAAYGGSGAGVIFKVTPTGKFSVLHTFDNTDGSSPEAPLIQASDNNFYGTTCCGGSDDSGVIFRISATGNFSVVHNMNAATDGGGPFGGLVQSADGNFYGVNAGGGNSSNCMGGCGTIFKVSSQGNVSVLYNFDYTDGAYPYATMLEHTNGIFYGDTWSGGISNSACTQSGPDCGVFYSMRTGLRRFISLLPYEAKVGKTVEILGQGFKGVSGVAFNGTPSKFNVVSDTYLTATVPTGATTGFVTVTTSHGSLKSNKKFRVTP